jgi:hypothetical protein
LLRAELMAAAVVAAHNHVLRRWLRGESPDPIREFDDAMREVITLFASAGNTDDGTTIIAFRTSQDLDTLLPLLRRFIEAPEGAAE